MSLRSQVGAIRRGILASLHRRTVSLGRRGPIITFTFDDFPRTALTNGAAILESFGARGTYYVAGSLMNQTNQLGEQFRREDILTLLDRGHEVASHTFHHSSARRVSFKKFQQDAEDGERGIQELADVLSSGNFAYPYGEATLQSKGKLGPRFVSSRGTCGGLNGPEVDLNLLRANNLYGGLERAESAKRRVEENKRLGQWLIFYTHDVTDAPSPYGCTLELLETVCGYAKAENMRFMTVADVMRELGQTASSLECVPGTALSASR